MKEETYVSLAVFAYEQHWKCRNGLYKTKYTAVQRFEVPDDKVDWDVEWAEYSPVEFTDQSVESLPPWADPHSTMNLAYNDLDGRVDRRSRMGHYAIDRRLNRPLNPCGRTGMTGRGLLGRWGPNHAADAIVTRWNREKNDLEFIAIERKDTHQWAIPGGMVDVDEKISHTVTRELAEEALGLKGSDAAQGYIKQLLDPIAKLIYAGYVDDPRNTDNAWMETLVYSFHDGNNTISPQFDLVAGDDAEEVQWMSVKRALSDSSFYASHAKFIAVVNDMYSKNYRNNQNN